MQYTIRNIFALLFVMFLMSYSSIIYAEYTTYPAETWLEVSPEDVGMDSQLLKLAAEYIGGNGCVIRHGKIVCHWGKYNKRSDAASAAKPVYAHFLFNAIEKGLIKSVDEQVSIIESKLNELNPDLEYKDRNITWRHLANQTSCYGVSEMPGTAFDYNDFQMSLFIDNLFLKVYKTNYKSIDSSLLHPVLTDAISCEDNPTFLSFGINNRPGRLAISPRDFARFGCLYLHDGVWEGKQLISSGFTKMIKSNPLSNDIPRTKAIKADMIAEQRSIGSTKIPDDQCDHAGSYSWCWWVNGIDRNGSGNWKDAPLDTFAALGHAGKVSLFIIPSLDIIVSWNGSKINGNESQNTAIKLLKDSVVDIESASNAIIVNKTNKRWFARRNGLPFFMCGPGDPEGFLYRGTLNSDGTRTGDQMEIINNLKGTGANCIYIMAIRSHGGDGDATQNPFIDNNPNKGLNDAALSQWETWLSEMDRNNIVIYFFIYDDNSRVWDNRRNKKISDAETKFIAALVNRFKHHQNLVWCIAEEYEEVFTEDQIKSIASIIRQNDAHHPIAVHQLNGLDFGGLAGDPNINQFAVQYNAKTAEELHYGILKIWDSAKGRYNINLSEAADFKSGMRLRKMIWSCAMAGAYSMVLGMDIANTKIEDLEYCGHLVRFMENTDFYNMAPNDKLAENPDDYVLASDDNFIIYSPKQSAAVGLNKIKPGFYDLIWYDCITGRWIIEPNREVSESAASWKKPTNLGDETALYVKKRS